MTPSEILEIKNVGESALCQIRMILRWYGMKLKDDK